MTLQQQYNLIKEGKGNTTHFLKNAKLQFPELFNAFTSYEQSVSVLISKGLISEGVGGVVTGGVEQDWVKIFRNNLSEEVKATEKKTSKDVEDTLSKKFDYSDEKNIDNVYGNSFLEGFYVELQDPKNTDKTVDEVKAIVAKNLQKDRLHYTKDGMFGVKGVGYTTEAPGLGTPKEPTGKYKSSGYGNLREGKEKRELSLKQIGTKDKKGLTLYKNTEDQNDLYYYDGKELYSVNKDGEKGPSVRMSLFNITGLNESLQPSTSYGDRVYSHIDTLKSAASKLTKPENYSVLTNLEGDKLLLTTNQRASEFEQGLGWRKIGKIDPNGEYVEDLKEGYEDTPEEIPAEVLDILDEYPDIMNGDYRALEKAKQHLESAVGWTFDYYLDGSIYDLQPLEDLKEGYEDTPEKIPAEVLDILDEYPDIMNGDYRALDKAKKHLESAVGWTFDYYLDGSIYDLRPMNELQEEGVFDDNHSTDDSEADVANTIYNKGKEFFETGDEGQAEKWYNKALEIGKTLGWTEENLPWYGSMNEGDKPKNTFLKPGEKYNPKPISSKDSTAHTVLDKLRKGMEKHVASSNKLREMIREMVLQELEEGKKKPSSGLTAKEKSTISKKAHAGKDIGEKGKGFEKVAKAASKQYGSKEVGQKVAAAAMWKNQAKKK